MKALIKSNSALSACRRYRAELEPTETLTYQRKDGTTGGGKLDYTVRVDRYTPLLPVADARAVIAEVEAACEPVGTRRIQIDGKEHVAATYLASLVLSAFPHRNPAEGFGKALASVFAEYPAEIGYRVAKAVRDGEIDSNGFVPAAPQIARALKAEMAKLRHKANVAEAHLAEHERRRGEAQRAAAVARDKANLTPQKKAQMAERVAAFGPGLSRRPAFDLPPLKRVSDVLPPQVRENLAAVRAERDVEDSGMSDESIARSLKSTDARAVEGERQS